MLFVPERFEAVVSPANPLIGSVVRDRFILSLHQAEIVAVCHRNGFLLEDEADVTASAIIEDHDILLIESYPSFAKAFRVSASKCVASTINTQRL